MTVASQRVQIALYALQMQDGVVAPATLRFDNIPRQVRGGGVRAPEADRRNSEGRDRTCLQLHRREPHQAIPNANLGGEAPGRIEIGRSAKLSIRGGSSFEPVARRAGDVS